MSRPMVRGAAAAGGWAAIAGAAVLALHAVLLAVRPAGCVAEGCVGGAPYRPSEDLAPLLLLALVLLTLALATEQGPPRGWWIAATAAFAGGAALLVVGIAVNGGASYGAALWWLHDTDTMPRSLAVLGTAMAGWAAVRSREPRSVGGVLLAAALLALPFNVQDWRVLLNLPIAVALGARGARRLLRSSGAVRPRAARRGPSVGGAPSAAPGRDVGGSPC